MSGTSKEQILSYVSDDSRKSITDTFMRAGKGMEFEFIFFSKKGHQMNKEKYVLLLKYMRNMAKAKKIQVTQPERSLDFGYTSSSLLKTDIPLEDDDSENMVYRVSVDGTDNINAIINRLNDVQNKNYLIYKFLLHTLKKNNKNRGLNFMLKSRGPKDTIDIDDLNMRARLSKETDLTDKIVNMKTLDENLNKLLTSESIDLEARQEFNKKIFFRLKERTSLYIEDADDHFIRIDITDTKTTKDIRKISDVSSNYELEIEYGVKGSASPKKEHLDTMYIVSENLMKFIQQSAFIIGNTMTDKVIQYYKDLSNIDTNINYLVARQPVSLEIQHVTEILPDKYAVTDKADGDRGKLIIYQKGVYFINTNLIVKDTGIVLDKKLEKYNGTIMDGEYIYIPKEKRHVYMAFDCIRNGANDLKPVVNFYERLANADTIIADCFIFKGQTGFKFKEPPQQTSFDADIVSKFYGNELVRFYDILNKDIKFVKEYPLIRRKFFMPVFGALRWEIFKYAVELWSKYTEDSNVKIPYHLDGEMFHPLEQAYVTNVMESKYHEYKWKPPVKNSMDFYIEFKKDPQTGKILDVYDNSLSTDKIDNTGEGNTGFVRNKTYRICTLYVGKSIDGREMPVPFEQNYGIADAYIYQRDGEIRDLSGDIITDKTVVEFYYQNDPNIIPQQRWVPIKTRYDKTESVEKYGRRYGNYSGTADRIWRSIINPVLMDDFIELAKGNTDKRNFYDIKIKEMNSKISHKLIVAVNKENKYYQKVTKIAATMRQFHNFIKSNLIYTYCNKMYQDNQQQSVLDIACGRGGDIGKFYYTEVAYLVGIDIDAEGFKSPVDGAISRYNAFRKKKPNFPKMYFIQADARSIFDYDSQVQALSGMDDLNKKLLQKFFPNIDEGHKRSMFDRINCQFAMHYFLKDQLSWNNFKQNLKNHLRSGGYFIATTFDAREVIRALGNRDTYTVYYDDSDGNKKKFFELVKRYDSTIEANLIGPGSGIDVYMSWAFDEGTYQTEYLVDFEFVKKDLEDDVDLEIIDSDLFSNQLVIHKKFIQDATRFESSAETKDYMSNVAQYYDNSEMNNKCMMYTNLHRYMVFRKKSPNDANSNKVNTKANNNVNNKKKQKGGKKENIYQNKINLQEKYNFSDSKQFKIPDMSNYDDQYSLVNSIHKILVSHSMFPKDIKVEEFLKDMGLNPVVDEDVTDDYIHKITDNITINHEIVEKGTSTVKNVIDGLNIFMIERDCNNFYDITYSTTDNYKDTDKAIVLMKEGGLYKPIMRSEEKGIRGILRMKDEMIRQLIENGETI
jgi:SAM-dependent methyltransferase